MTPITSLVGHFRSVRTSHSRGVIEIPLPITVIDKTRLVPPPAELVMDRRGELIWSDIDAALSKYQWRLTLGIPITYGFEVPEIKKKYYRTRKYYSHIPTPNKDELVELDIKSLSLQTQAHIRARAQAVAPAGHSSTVFDNSIKLSTMGMDSVLDAENQVSRIEDIKGYTVAIEATWYLQRFIEKDTEPLVSALGGLPYGLKSEIEADLDNWKRHGLTPMFVFDGLYIIGQEDMALRVAKKAARDSDKAWDAYRDAKVEQQLKDAVRGFGALGAIQPKMFYLYLQEILHKRGLYYEISSHSACAQMAYLDKHPTRKDGKQAFETLIGSSELLLYDIDYAIVTKIDFTSGLIHLLAKPVLAQKLNVTEDTFADALLMTGTSFLPAFPVLKDTDIIKQQPFTINDAINTLRTANKSIITLCDTWTEILQKQEPNWQDKYRKAKMAVKHHIHVEERGGVAAVVVSNSEELTGDHPEYIALNLPQELYHYLIHGNIGRRVMNWLSYLEILVFPPLAGGDTLEYRRLVTEQLVPIQSQSVALYTSRLHRGFQHRDITVRFWFDNTTTVVIKPLAVDPAPDGLAAGWRVNQVSFGKQKALKPVKPGSFSFAMFSLQEAEFVKLTQSAVSETQNLKSESEIMSNAMWRLLHLRGYIDNEHRPTKWGTALITTLDLINPMGFYSTKAIEEAAFLAFELLRFDQLNARNRHPEWIGAPQNGSEQDRNHCLLISRCACLIKLRHKETGYTGPLSKNLLAHQSAISAVRAAHRDLVEAIIASMFMFAHADRTSARDESSEKVRKRNNLDWQKLGLSLPFGKDVDIALGIAVRTYLDDYAKPDMAMDEKQSVKVNYVNEKLPYSVDFESDLGLAFNFFDALYAGVSTLSGEIPEADIDVWKGAHNYLAERT